MATFYRLAIIILISLLSQAVFAQDAHLKGILKDAKGEALPFANVAVLLVADSSLVTGTVTDFDGKFTISTPAAGKYLLRLSAIGYKGKTSEAFTITGPAENKDFGTLVLREDVEVMQAVQIEALRPIVSVEADKMVVSVEGTAMAAGSTALDVLSKSPGVWMDQDGNLQLNGKAGVKVMIDGRPTYLTARELQNMLAGMSAENIKNIEIIANPSAEQDAEGSAGILNINLKKNTISGMNGSVYAGYQYNRVHGVSGGASLNYKKNRLNTSLKLDIADRQSYKTLNMVREFNQSDNYARFEQQTYEDRWDYTPSVQLGTDYEINKNHAVGMNARISRHDTYQDFNSQMDLIRSNTSENLQIASSTPVREDQLSSTLNLFYQGKLDTVGTTFSANLDYVKLQSETTGDFNNQFTDAAGNMISKESLSNDNPSAYDIYSARLDFGRKVFKAGKLDMGVKASHVVSDSRLTFYALEGNIKQVVESMSNHFIYRENIFAAYATLNTKLNDKWTIKGGLRAEQTYSEGESVNLGQTNKKNYLDLFPSLFVQQKVSNNYQINYNYSRRIQRPRYESLNPFLVYLDPYTIAQGNPHLRPEYINSFQLTQTYKQAYNLVLGYAISKDFSTEVPMQNNETQQTVFGQQNIDRFESVTATLVAPVEILPKWSTFNNAVLAYQSYETNLNGLHQVNEQVFFMAQSNHTIKLPAGFTAEAGLTYRGPLAHGLYQIAGAWWANAGVKRSFMQNRLDVSINANDIFRTLQETGTADIGVNRNQFEQYRGMQSIRLNLRYRFSKGEKFDSKNRGSELEELNRAGGE